MMIQRLRISLQQTRILPLYLGVTIASRPPKTLAQHRLAALHSHPAIRQRVQHIAQAQVAKTDIRRVDQVAAGIRQGSIKIKNDTAHGVSYCSPHM